MNECFLYIKEGKITNSKVIRHLFEGLKDGSYQLKIEAKKKRSHMQNAFYWGCVLPIVKDGLCDVGYREVKTDQDAHEILKTLFLKKKIVNENSGEEIIIPGSTAKLTTLEFCSYIDEITQWASEYLSIVIPSPGEYMPMFTAEYDQEISATIIQKP